MPRDSDGPFLDQTGAAYLWDQVTSLAAGYLPLAGGTVSGNVTANYVTSTWLRTTAAGDVGSSAYTVAVIRDDGWVYKASPSRICAAGLTAGENVTIGPDGTISATSAPDVGLYLDDEGYVCQS